MTTDTDTILRISKVIPAAREAVFSAWTDPEQIKQWSCPPDASVLDSQVDLEVGGAFRLRMRGMEDAIYTAFGTYREIVRPSRLVYTWDWEEQDRAVGETIVTVDFIEMGDSTEVVITHEGFPAAEATEGHRQGWTGSLLQLEQLFA